MKAQEQMKKQSDAIKAIFLDWLRDSDHIITGSEIDRMYDDMLDEYPVVIGSLEYPAAMSCSRLTPLLTAVGFPIIWIAWAWISFATMA